MCVRQPFRLGCIVFYGKLEWAMELALKVTKDAMINQTTVQNGSCEEILARCVGP